MESSINYNALHFGVFVLPEFYLSICFSAISFSLLFTVAYYIIVPQLIKYPYFPHIGQCTFLHWKIVDTSISMIHGIVIILLCIVLESAFVFSLTQQMVNSHTTSRDIIIASISAGYIIYDTIIGCIICSKLHRKTLDYMYIFHHIVAMSGLLMCVFQVYGSRPIIIGVFINEITNPLLHINNLKNKLIPRNQTINNKQLLFIDLMVKLIYIISFSIARFVWLNHILYQVLFTLQCSIYFKIVAVLLIMLPFALLPSLLKDLSKTYGKYKDIKHSQHLQYVLESTRNEAIILMSKRDEMKS